MLHSAHRGTRMGGRRKQHPFGRQFDERRTQEGHGDVSVLLENHVNLPNVAGPSHSDHLMSFSGSSRPQFTIKYLSPKLKDPQFARGSAFFGPLVKPIN